jgi:hypothetical protein
MFKVLSNNLEYLLIQHTSGSVGADFKESAVHNFISHKTFSLIFSLDLIYHNI